MELDHAATDIANMDRLLAQSGREIYDVHPSQFDYELDLEACELEQRESIVQHLRASRIYIAGVYELNQHRATNDWLFALLYCYKECAATLAGDCEEIARLVLEKHLIGTLDCANRTFEPPLALLRRHHQQQQQQHHHQGMSKKRKHHHRQEPKQQTTTSIPTPFETIMAGGERSQAMAHECQNMRSFYTVIMTIMRYSMLERQETPLGDTAILTTHHFMDRHGNQKWASLFDHRGPSALVAASTATISAISSSSSPPSSKMMMAPITPTMSIALTDTEDRRFIRETLNLILYELDDVLYKRAFIMIVLGVETEVQKYVSRRCPASRVAGFWSRLQQLTRELIQKTYSTATASRGLHQYIMQCAFLYDTGMLLQTQQS